MTPLPSVLVKVKPFSVPLCVGGQDQPVVAGRDLHDRRLHARIGLVDGVGELAQGHAAGGDDVHGRLCTDEQAQRAAGGDDLVPRYAVLVDAVTWALARWVTTTS